MHKQKIILLLLILAVAMFFRFYKLDEIPPGLYPDVAVNGTDAVEALRTGDFRLYYPENNGREGLFINLIALSFWLFGPSVWAIKVVPAFFGVLTVLGTYLLTKQLTLIPSSLQMRGGVGWGVENYNITSPNPSSTEEGRQNTNPGLFGLTASEAVALLSTFFLAISFWHVNFSRLGFRAIMVPFFLVWSIYFLLKAMPICGYHTDDADKRNKLVASGYLLVAGLLFGLGFQTYISFRVAPLILAPIFIFDVIKKFSSPPQLRRGQRGGVDNSIQHPTPPLPSSEGRGYAYFLVRWLIFVLGIIIAASPMIYYFYQNPSDFMGRATQVSVFASKNPALTLAWSTIKTLGQFIIYGDPNQRHNISGSPQIFWPLIPFFIIGITYSIRQIFKKQNYKNPPPTPPPFEGGGWEGVICHWILIIWWGAMLLPSIFTNEGLPHALRSIGAIPPSYIFTGLGMFLVIKRLLVSSSPQLRGGLRWGDESLTPPPLTPPQLRRGGITKNSIILFLFFAFCISLVAAEYYRYFIYWGQAKATQNAYSKDLYDGAIYLKNLPKGVKKYVIMNEGSPNDCHQGISISSHTIKFIAPQDTEFTWRGCPKFQEWLNPHTSQGVGVNPAKQEPTIFLPLARDEGLFNQLRQAFQSGGVENHDNFAIFRVNF